MPKVTYHYELNGRLVTGNDSLMPFCSLSNRSLLPSLTLSKVNPLFITKIRFLLNRETWNEKLQSLQIIKKYKKDFLLGTVLSWRKVSMRSSVKRDWLNSRTRSPTLMVSSRILKNKSILFECSTSPMT